MVELTKEMMVGFGASDERAQTLVNAVREAANAQEVWHALRKALTPADDFALHQSLFQHLSDGQPNVAAWMPTREQKEQSTLYQWMQELGHGSVAQCHAWSVGQKADFWQKVVDALALPFHTVPNAMMGAASTAEKPVWLEGAYFNIAEACLQGRPDQVAIHWQVEGGACQQMSYAELRALSGRVAAGLKAIGIKAGDAVAIDMVMTAESVAIYLGIVQLGAVVVSVADSFAADEIRTRLELADAKLIFTQDVLLRGTKTLPLYEKVCAASGCKAVVLPAQERLHEPLRPGDVEWSRFLADEPMDGFYSATPDHACNILFSSGTTGHPKVIPWSHTTPIKCAADAMLHHDMGAGDVLCWPTNLGWMMGPWLLFAGLLNKASIALYYGPPLGKEFGDFVADTHVTMLGLVPSMVKYWRASGCMDGVNWSGLRMFSSTGECSSPEDYLWLMSRVQGYRPVIEYCGGTEIGGAYVTSSYMQPNAPSCFATKALGMDMVVLDADNQPCAEAQEGEVYLLPPSIGLSLELLAGRDHHETYYKDTPAGSDGALLRRHGDEIVPLGDGAFQALGRADDTMNLGGIKTSSAEIERVLNGHEGVLETAAIAATPHGGGPQELVVYVVLEKTVKYTAAELVPLLQARIRANLNPLFKIEDVVLTNSLPRTASNKVMRRVLRDEYVEARQKAA